MKEILFPFAQGFLYIWNYLLSVRGWGGQRGFNPFLCTSGPYLWREQRTLGESMAVPASKNKAGAWVFIVKIEALSPGCLVYQSTWILFNQHLRKFDIPGCAELPWDLNLKLTVDQVWPRSTGESSCNLRLILRISSPTSPKFYLFLFSLEF